MRRTVAVLGLCALAGCGVFEQDCTTDARPALSVSVVDSLTGGLPLSDSIIGVARDGGFSDTVRYPVFEGMSPLFLAYERAGTYQVDVHAEGYASWSRQGIRVDKGECHVRGAQLVAKLVRLEAP